MSYSEPAQLMSRCTGEKRKKNPPLVRATCPKIRLCWTGLRIESLLLSPIYRGYHSEKRCTKPGRMVIRDNRSWVPLILLTINNRLAEVL